MLGLYSEILAIQNSYKQELMKILLFFFVILISFSCSTFHEVTIEPDRSAFVKSDAYYFDSLRVLKSSIISDFSYDKSVYSFRISDVDSLGNYMGDIISDNYFAFNFLQ